MYFLQDLALRFDHPYITFSTGITSKLFIIFAKKHYALFINHVFINLFNTFPKLLSFKKQMGGRKFIS